MSWLILLYLIGCVVSYFLARYWWTKEDDWTLGDRVFFIIGSLFSWFGVFATGLALLIEYLESDPFDKKVKW